jgi:hypothetical protein
MKNQSHRNVMGVWGVFRAVAKACNRAGWTGATAMFVGCAAIAGVMTLPKVHGASGAQAGASSSSTPTYTFTTIDVPGVGNSALQGTLAISINAGGDIAGVFITASNAAHGFVRAAATGTISKFDAPNAGTAVTQGTFATRIELAGNVTGMYADSNNAYHGFLRAPDGTITEFDVPGAPTTMGHRGTIPLGVNAALQITGFFVDANAVRHGFIRAANGTFTTFDFPGAGTGPTQGTVPVKINGPGGVMGFYVDGNQVFHGFVRNAGGTFSLPIDAPNAGRVAAGKGLKFTGTLVHSFDGLGGVGGIYTDANFVFHGFLLSASSVFTSIDVPGASTTGVFGGTLLTSVDGFGDVTGAYSDANGVEHGFAIAGGTSTINAPLDAPGAGTAGFFAGTVPLSINGTGELAGTYADPGGIFHGFLATASPVATPVFSPVPGTFSSSQAVSISDATPNSTIFYTTDGTSPATSASALQYSGPIPVTSTETIQAIAGAAGFANSAVVSGTYTINNSPPPDFQLSVNPTSLTIVAGQSGTAMFTVTPQNGFNSPVSFACSGLPAGASCNFNPASVTPNGSAVSSTLTVSTTAASAALQMPLPISLRPSYAFLFPVLAMILGIAAHRSKALRGLSLLGLLTLLIVASGLTSCSGGSSVTGNPGTPVGTTVASVSAAAGAGGPSHTANLTITIRH